MKFKSKDYIGISLVALPLALASAFLLSSCQKPTCSNCLFSTSANSTNSVSSTSGTGGTNTVGTFTIQTASLNSFNLGTTQAIPVTITADKTYSGTVALTISEPELLAVDPGQAINFSFSPSSVSLTPGSSATSTLTVNVGTMAPDFASSLFHIVATDTSQPAGQAYVTSMPSAIQVNAMYVVNIIKGAEGGIPENWTVAAGSTVKFKNHPNGLTVVFNDLDTNTTMVPRIHSTAAAGTILHQPGSLTASLDGVNPNPNGGSYSQTVTIQTEASDLIYDHNYESGSEGRTFLFNVPVSSPSPTPSTNPNATYTYLNTNVFQPMCVSCHSPTNKSGGYDLSTYTGVSAAVQKGSSLTSPLYEAVQSGSMPKGGTPLSGTLVQDIGDWINSGAPNN